MRMYPYFLADFWVEPAATEEREPFLENYDWKDEEEETAVVEVFHLIGFKVL